MLTTSGAAGRNKPLFILFLAQITLLFLVSNAAHACGPDSFCEVAGGRYLAVPPTLWDGHRPLPTTVFFHGYNGSAQATRRNTALLSIFDELGVLLILPDGLNHSWAHSGSPSQARDELAFMDAVLTDVKRRWPVDEQRLRAMGFSQGGSMVWELACRRGYAYAAFMPISGAFWEPLPEHCTGGPVNLRHVHGTSDPVVPLQGRPIAGRFRQGDVRTGFRRWLAADGCTAAPDRVAADGPLRCEIWHHCTSGKELQLCLHDGGHNLPAEWVRQAQSWAERQVLPPPTASGVGHSQ